MVKFGSVPEAQGLKFYFVTCEFWNASVAFILWTFFPNDFINFLGEQGRRGRGVIRKSSSGKEIVKALN